MNLVCVGGNTLVSNKWKQFFHLNKEFWLRLHLPPPTKQVFKRRMCPAKVEAKLKSVNFNLFLPLFNASFFQLSFFVFVSCDLSIKISITSIFLLSFELSYLSVYCALFILFSFSSTCSLLFFLRFFFLLLLLQLRFSLAVSVHLASSQPPTRMRPELWSGVSSFHSFIFFLRVDFAKFSPLNAD